MTTIGDVAKWHEAEALSYASVGDDRRAGGHTDAAKVLREAMELLRKSALVADMSESKPFGASTSVNVELCRAARALTKGTSDAE